MVINVKHVKVAVLQWALIDGARVCVRAAATAAAAVSTGTS